MASAMLLVASATLFPALSVASAKTLNDDSVCFHRPSTPFVSWLASSPASSVSIIANGGHGSSSINVVVATESELPPSGLSRYSPSVDGIGGDERGFSLLSLTPPPQA